MNEPSEDSMFCIPSKVGTKEMTGGFRRRRSADPLAAAEKDLHEPSGDSMCSLLKATEVAGLRMLEAPPTMA